MKRGQIRMSYCIPAAITGFEKILSVSLLIVKRYIIITR
jgi:hypothetical protein